MSHADDFDAYAVPSSTGPHVTLQAGVRHLGRHWTTTTRGSVKVGAINRRGVANVTSVDGDGWRVIGGRARTLDPARPWTFAADPVAGALAGGAMARLVLGQLDQLLGYAEAGVSVPAAFLPTGRVLLVTNIEDQLVIEGDRVVRSVGRWATEREPLEGRAGSGTSRGALARLLSTVPDDVGGLTRSKGAAWLGVDTPTGAVALPASWDPNDRTAQVSGVALTAIAAVLPGRVCLTFDNSTSRRPDAKIGLMLRGSGRPIAVDGHAATLALDVDRVTYWNGFRSATTGGAA